jgi:hypothetical protein
MRFGLHALPTHAAVCIASGDMKDHGALEPALAMSTDGASGAPDVFDLTRRANAQRVQVREAMRTVVVAGDTSIRWEPRLRAAPRSRSRRVW